jgi:surfactin synthase thioesterase subunit/NAD(P)-dependent dehydrogenase (short-subunit alcohol dehydrogenase family)/acyl carrier protein
MAQACLQAKGKSATWIATLNRQRSDAESMTDMLAALYVAGHTVNWTAVHADASWRRVPLPTYPFQRKRHWIEDNTTHTERPRNAVEQIHPLVGKRINSTNGEVRYEARYGVQHAAYFSDHRVVGTIVLPTTAELEAAIVVARMHFGTPRVSFDDAMHHQAMSFTNGEDRIVRVSITPLKSDRASFSLVSAATEDSEVWHTHMTGTLRKSEAPSSSTFSTNQVRARCRQTLPVADLYDGLAEFGLEYGPSFRGVRELYFGQHEALTKVQLPDGLVDTQYVMHPAFLDACLHAYPLVLDGAEKAKGNGRSSYLPVSLAAFRCYRDGIDEAWVHTRLRSVEKDDTQVVDIRVYDAAERPVAELKGLAVRLLPLDKVQRPRDGTDDLFYRAVWRKSVRATVNSAQDRAPASWIIFADEKGVGGALASRLEAAGHHCHLVYRDHAFVQVGTRKWAVNERQPHEFRRLLEQSASSETLPCRGVVYLWGLDTPSIEGLTLARLKSGNEMMCRGALAILHALAETRSTSQTGRRLWFVTANTQKTEGPHQHVDPLQAPLWGLGRTVAIEYPGIWGGLIDLQLNSERVPDIDSLAAELLHPDGETQIAISAAGERSVARFAKQPLAELPARMPRVRGDATYLVTGGLGMLGRSVAKWLISKGAKHLVLTGRNASSEAAQKVFSAAEINSAAIHVVAADIGRDEDVRRLLQTIRNELPPLKGIVHSAGVLDDGILAQLDWDRFAPLFQPRVYGSWLLHECTKSLELDFFIFESSLLSLLGSAGQGNYTASSAFLDSLAAHRRAAGLPAIAINWCAWSGGGLATVSGARGEQMWSSLGVEFVSPDLAMQAFDRLMHRDVEQIAVAVADWTTYAEKVGEPSFLAELLNRNEVSGSSKSAQGKVTPDARPIEVPADARPAEVNGQARQQLLSKLQQHIMAKLGFAEVIDPDQPLNELGLDSLMSVALSNSLEAEFGIPISVRELIKGPTINQLADGLLRELGGSFPTEPKHASGSAAVAMPIVVREAAVRPPAENEQASSEMWTDEILPAEAQIAGDQYPSGLQLQRLIQSRAPGETAIGIAGNGNDSDAVPAVRTNTEAPPARKSNGAGAEDFGTPVSRPVADAALRTAGKWLIAPRPNPAARARLFCFPYAGGGLVSFRAWPQLLDDSVEVVAVEPPGRGTRINETPIDDLNTFVERLLPELIDWLDRPSAFFGHCLGGLTMFATLCALPEACAHFIKYAFACGVRPPHLLKRMGAFEDNLAYDMMLHRDFDVRVPPTAQTDEVFANIIRQFDTPAADKMLDIPKLRKLLLPTIRAEFAMAYNYKYRPVAPFSFPISSFVGDLDPWVKVEDSAGWGELTRGGFTNHARKGSHFLMADDGRYILETIKAEFVKSVVEGESQARTFV